MCHSAEKFRRGESFSVSLFSGIEEFFASVAYVTIFEFLSMFFLSHSADKFSRGTLYCFIIFEYRNCLDKRRESIKIFRRKLFVSQCRKFPWGNPLVFHHIRVQKRFGSEGGGGGVSSFSVQIFLSHTAEKFRRGTLWCFIVFGHRKCLHKRGGEYQDFPFKIFRLTVPKNFVGEPFRVSLFWVPKKLMNKVGEYQDFRRNFFVSQCRVIS